MTEVTSKREVQAGDKIRMTVDCPDNGFKKGDIFEVVRCSGAMVTFVDNDGDTRNRSYGYEVVEAADAVPKVGDKVRATADWIDVKKGYVYRVSSHVGPSGIRVDVGGRHDTLCLSKSEYEFPVAPKVGDVVKSLVDECDVTKGTRYAVVGIMPDNGVHVRDDVGDTWGLYKDQYEFLTALEIDQPAGDATEEATIQDTKPKAGDRVKALDAGGDFTEGAVYEVLRFDPRDASVLVKDDVDDEAWLFDGEYELLPPFAAGGTVVMVSGQTFRNGSHVAIVGSVNGRDITLTLGDTLLASDLAPFKALEFKAGDKVKIARKVVAEAGWDNAWAPQMDKRVGDGEILVVDYVDDYGVHLKDVWFGWPKGALDLVTEAPAVAVVNAAARAPEVTATADTPPSAERHVFKPGDKAKIIDEGGGSGRIGDIVTIRSYDSSDGFCWFEDGGCLYSYRLEPVADEPVSTIKVGDVVRDSRCHEAKGKVKRIDDDGDVYIERDDGIGWGATTLHDGFESGAAWHIYRDRAELVSAAERAAPKPAFKVGDRVVYRGYPFFGARSDCYGTVLCLKDGRVRAEDWSVGSPSGWLDADKLELVSSTPATPAAANDNDIVVTIPKGASLVEQLEAIIAALKAA